jgi:glycosyltransferase involved in cell wall biosynthesis
LIGHEKDFQEKNMRLILTLLVRDEIDIIKGMIDYHLAHGVDHIIITDNGSIDGTYEVCKQYALRGKVDVLVEPPSDFSQHRWVTRMANIAYEKYNADWVIHADADEMFVPARRYRNLKESLRYIPKNISVLQVPRHDFVPFNRSMRQSPHIEMVYRKAVSVNLKGEPLPPKVIHRGAKDVVISQGNHSVKGNELGDPCKSDELSVYHYPIRSCKQFHSKVSNGGSGYQNNTELDPCTGFHKRYWYDLLQKNKLSDVYYKEHFLTSKQLKNALELHSLVEDYRVADYFQNKYSVRLRHIKEFFVGNHEIDEGRSWSLYHKV